jgi:hypothetical protein
MNVKDAQMTRTALKTLTELSEAKNDAKAALRNTCIQCESTSKLWREGNKSRLIKIGMALVVFPEPTPLSETIGAGFIAAGAVQNAIRSRAIYIEDIGKTLKDTFRDVIDTKHNL